MNFAEEAANIARKGNDYAIMYLAMAVGELQKQVTTPPQRTWVGLTDEERDECWDMLLGTNEFNREGITKTIEAKLKEKNT